VLNAWNLNFDLKISVSSQKVSESYFLMSLQILEFYGFSYNIHEGLISISKFQEINESKKFDAEIDLSCAFAIAALASVAGECEFVNFPNNSTQADLSFVSILKRMGVNVESKSTGELVIKKNQLHRIDQNLADSPDMFPVLASLCALATGLSHLNGAKHLVWKESDRIKKTYELIKNVASYIEPLEDGINIEGSFISDKKLPDFDIENDHRMGMAAAVIWNAGYKFKIIGAQAVTKSFPDFWLRAKIPEEYLVYSL
jgi:3-phosphoshikimate 1-carboxyvinyltransferase